MKYRCLYSLVVVALTGYNCKTPATTTAPTASKNPNTPTEKYWKLVELND
ncbi:hypothetical protein SAMN05444008_11461 [Cnuella takakiae]|uniref:Uncharacterized protein n=1 Tax=Cnuella takakiae TaxID=1302690 RepID=A0A1M5FLJ6_9BACT|nr:hypothetical protein [Cnuella takakiae]SHF92378.1 hypothetical protein SAMN05444008_11461 [Cnuella takakiae]